MHTTTGLFQFGNMGQTSIPPMFICVSARPHWSQNGSKIWPHSALQMSAAPGNQSSLQTPEPPAHPPRHDASDAIAWSLLKRSMMLQFSMTTCDTTARKTGTLATAQRRHGAHIGWRPSSRHRGRTTAGLSRCPLQREEVDGRHPKPSTQGDHLCSGRPLCFFN